MKMPLQTPLPLLEDADIGFDGHHVLMDPQGVKREFVRRVLGKRMSSWLLKSDRIRHFLDEVQYERVRRNVYERWYWFRQAPAVDGMHDAINRILAAMELVGVKKRFRVVSSSGPKAYVNLIRWCDRRIGLGQNDAHVVSSGREGNKAELVRGLVFFLENDLDKLEKIRGIVPRLRLLKTEHTKHLLLPDDVKLVTWGQFADEVVEWIKKTYGTVNA